MAFLDTDFSLQCTINGQEDKGRILAETNYIVFDLLHSKGVRMWSDEIKSMTIKVDGRKSSVTVTDRSGNRVEIQFMPEDVAQKLSEWAEKYGGFSGGPKKIGSEYTFSK